MAALLGRPAPPLVVPAHPLSRMMRAARLRDVRSPERPSSAKDPGGAVDAAAGGVYLGGRRGRLGVAQVARARRPLPPCAVALPGDMEGRAHLGYAPGAPVEQDGSEPRPLRPRAYGCLPVRKALAFKIISFSLFGRSFSRPSPRRSYATWKGLPPAECLGDGRPVPCPLSPFTASCPNGTRCVNGNGGDSDAARHTLLALSHQPFPSGTTRYKNSALTW